MNFDQYLKEVRNGFTIHCDMDGVITDFVSAFEKIDGSTINQIDSTGGTKFWDHVAKGGLEFWSNMPWMKDGKKLWSFIKKSDPIMLSSPAKSLPNSPKGKKIWVKRELGNPPLILKIARDKMQYAGPNKILIDDLKKNIDQWEMAGGIGILHTSADKTIAKLKKIMKTTES